MLCQSIFVLASAISASVLASSDLCLQGCCGLAFKLPSTSLTLHFLTTDESYVQVPLSSPEITCCPCDNSSGQPQALLQPTLPVNNDTGIAAGPVPSNGTTTPPKVPPQTKPDGPVHDSPLDAGNPCPQNTCFSDCDCAPGIPVMDFAIRKPVNEQAAISMACPQGQCHADSDRAPGITPTEDGAVSVASPRANLPHVASPQAGNMPTCPEGQCTPDCECSVDALLAFINPGIPLASMPRVCAPGECSADCICRDDLIKTAQVVASLKKHNSSSKLKGVVGQKGFAGKSEL